MTTIVHVHDGFDEYIGRAVRRAKDQRCHKRSVYANPYIVGKDGTREWCLATYEDLWRHRLASVSGQHWRSLLLALEGKRLGCWCAPKRCHGDVLVKLIEEIRHVDS